MYLRTDAPPFQEWFSTYGVHQAHRYSVGNPSKRSPERTAFCAFALHRPSVQNSHDRPTVESCTVRVCGREGAQIQTEWRYEYEYSTSTAQLCTVLLLANARTRNLLRAHFFGVGEPLARSVGEHIACMQKPNLLVDMYCTGVDLQVL